MVRIYGVTTKPSTGGTNTGSGNVPSLALSGITLSSSSTPLTTDGRGVETESTIIIIPANKVALFTIQIVANTEVTPHKAASWIVSGMAKRDTDASSVSILGISPVSSIGDDEMENTKIELSENISFGGISIRCYGVFNYTSIKWAATVTLTEV